MTVALTIPGRVNFPNLFEAKPSKLNPEPRFSSVILIPKTDTKTVNKVKKAIEEAKKEGEEIYKVSFAGASSPLHDGDIEKADHPEYAGCYYLTAWSKEDNPPKLVDRLCNEIIDRSMLYSGCWANFGINFFSYNKGGRGVGVGLNGVQFVKDDKRFDGRPSVDQMFQVIADDDFDTDF